MSTLISQYIDTLEPLVEEYVLTYPHLEVSGTEGLKIKLQEGVNEINQGRLSELMDMYRDFISVRQHPHYTCIVCDEEIEYGLKCGNIHPSKALCGNCYFGLAANRGDLKITCPLCRRMMVGAPRKLHQIHIDIDGLIAEFENEMEHLDEEYDFDMVPYYIFKYQLRRLGLNSNFKQRLKIFMMCIGDLDY
jgi:hypothetical protein